MGIAELLGEYILKAVLLSLTVLEYANILKLRTSKFAEGLPMIKSIDVATLQSKLNNDEVILIDVREPFEFASQSIKSATNIPLGDIAPHTLPNCEGKMVVMQCRSGKRSLSACKKISEAVGTDIEICNLEGGIIAWNDAGFPTLCSDKKTLPLDQQVQLTIGIILIISSLLGYFVNPSFILVATFIGCGLSFAGLTGTCYLARVIAKMPWNKTKFS